MSRDLHDLHWTNVEQTTRNGRKAFAVTCRTCKPRRLAVLPSRSEARLVADQHMVDDHPQDGCDWPVRNHCPGCAARRRLGLDPPLKVQKAGKSWRNKAELLLEALSTVLDVDGPSGQEVSQQAIDLVLEYRRRTDIA